MLLTREQGSASRARQWVVDRARETGLPDADLDVVELLAGELIANAIKHGPDGGDIHVDTRSGPERFGVFVFDDSGLVPVLQDRSTDGLGGRGILLVDALAADWGCTAIGPDSKAVWFYVAVPRAGVLRRRDGTGTAGPGCADEDVPPNGALSSAS